MTAQGSGLPMAVQGGGLPMAAQGSGLPMYAPGGGLPMTAQGSGLPMAVPGGGLPMAAQGGGLPMAMPGGGLPMPATGQGYPMAVPGGGLPAVPGQGDGLAFDLPPVPGGEAALQQGAFDDSDRAVPAQLDPNALSQASGIDVAGAPRAAVGDEADLALDLSQAAREGGAAGQQQQKKREGEAKPKKLATGRKAAVAAGVLLMLGGAALSLVPSCGPFGFYFVSDQINAKTYADQLAGVQKTVGASLDEDTFASVGAAIEKCKAARADMPRFRPAAGYCAMVATERGLRFGRRSDDEALAKQLLLSAGDEGGAPAALANAALDALAGQTDKARPNVVATSQKPGGEEGVVLLGFVEQLAKGHEKDAVAAWKKAVDQKKTARTQYGLARAMARAGDNKGAEATARAALNASNQHAGARILLASLLWADAREKEALDMLKQVTDDGAVRKAAGDVELVEAYTLLGRIHLGRSRITAAEQAFAAALKLDPLAVGALVGNGELFYRSGRYAEALSRYDAATRADPDSVIARVGTAKTWIATERAKDAQAALKELQAKHPNDPLVPLWLGHAAETLGNKKEAEQSYADAIKIGENKPESVDAYVALAHLLSGLGRGEDANAKLAEATKRFPDLPALHRAKGEVALQAGRYDEARQELEAALAKDDDLGTRFKLGVAFRRMRRFDEAAAIFDKVASIDSDVPGLALERGLLFEATNQTEKAEKAYTEALAKAPNDVDLKLRVGSTEVIGGAYDKAIKILEEVRKERQNSAEANHFLGRAMMLKGTDVAGAMRFLEQAVNIDPNVAEYHLYVGWAANLLNQPAKASVALKKALDIDHELADAYWQRGVLLQKEGTSRDALQDLQTALEKRPSRFEAYATMGLCYEDLQRWREAQDAFRRAIAGNDKVAEWHYFLGKLLASHGGGAVASGPELDKAIKLVEAADAGTPAWLADAHFLLAEALRAKDKAGAIEHYNRFIELATNGNAYIVEAQKNVTALGGKPVQR
jgi:tetratricopeptide (TPR) repeat protein